MRRKKEHRNPEYYRKETATRLVLNNMPSNVWKFLEANSKTHGVKRGVLVHLALAGKLDLFGLPSPDWDKVIPRVTIHAVPEKTVRAVEKRAEKCSSRAEALCLMLGEVGA